LITYERYQDNLY
jgi:hypothetical protein